jgi:hypothetical protein
VRDEYREAAAQFRDALRPYLLRRDKREDEDVLKFKEASGLPVRHTSRTGHFHRRKTIAWLPSYPRQNSCPTFFDERLDIDAAPRRRMHKRF